MAKWLKSLQQKHQIGVMVTDDLATYKELADNLKLGHQVCQFHVRRWVGRKMKVLGYLCLLTNSKNSPTTFVIETDFRTN